MSSLAADRARLAEINPQILDLERALRELQSEKQVVCARLDSYKYPVFTLPNEIIIEIFIHFLPTYPHCPKLTGRFSESPVLLTRICRKWREIALDTPVLWRAIAISRSYPRVPSERQVQLCNMWLNRSGCYPLSLDFSDDAIDPLHPTELLSAVVVPRCARWEHLDLQLSLAYLRTIHGPMPLLRSLCLEAAEAEYDVATSVDLFRNAPLLRTATLNDVAAAWLILPWAQLISLTLHGVYPRECVPILQHTSNLVDCHLHLVKNDTDGIPDVTLPSLQSLALRGEWVTGYLETLIVPALRHLQIPEPSLEPHCIDTLASFISKAGCKLQNLCLTYSQSKTDDAYRQAFPSMIVYFADS